MSYFMAMAIRNLVILTIQQVAYLRAILNIESDAIRYEEEDSDEGFVCEEVDESRFAVAYWGPHPDCNVSLAIKKAWEFNGYIQYTTYWENQQLLDFLWYVGIEKSVISNGSISISFDIEDGGITAHQFDEEFGDFWCVTVWGPSPECQFLSVYNQLEEEERKA